MFSARNVTPKIDDLSLTCCGLAPRQRCCRWGRLASSHVMATAEGAQGPLLERSKQASSGFKFVHWRTELDCYQLKKKLCDDDEFQTSLGFFRTAEAAATAYANYRDHGIQPISDHAPAERKKRKCVPRHVKLCKIALALLSHCVDRLICVLCA